MADFLDDGTMEHFEDGVVLIFWCMEDEHPELHETAMDYYGDEYWRNQAECVIVD